MKKYLRLLGTVLVLLALAAAVYAASSSDGPVSLRYIKETFIPKTVQAGEKNAEEALQKTYDAAKQQLDALQNGASPSGCTSDTLEQRLWSDGQIITLSTGGCFLPIAGSLDLVHTGAVVDVTTGTEVPSRGQMAVGHRYIVGEDTEAAITVRSGEAALGVQGVYGLTAGKDKHTPFFDVSQEQWFYEPANYVYQKGLFGGTDTHHFSPGVSMNRAMMMVVLYGLADRPAQTGKSPFSDVPDGAWYTNAVIWGVSNGIAAGTGSGFSPENGITREQTVLILYNYAAYYMGRTMEEGVDLRARGFGDVDKVSSWAVQAMSWAVGQGILSGSSVNGVLCLNPQQGASRAEMATMLRAFCEKIL